MKLSGLKFVIRTNDELSEKEKDYLIDVYHKLFINIYGNDFVDAFSYVTKTNAKELINETYDVKILATNYNKAKDLLDNLKEDANSELLLIYINENNLIGSALIKRMDSVNSIVPYITLDGVDKDLEREIWKKTVSFIEKYLNNLGFQKMYLEIPLKEGPLLIRAKELGFKEDLEDILVEDVYTYILNKNLEGNNSNVEQNISY
ncbi:MAG: hypothetical protein E7161_03650 [Firmicutes bacterium]|nr:hypothetical protein [Bacillota bacterium]